jgi:hypothetical protein
VYKHNTLCALCAVHSVTRNVPVSAAFFIAKFRLNIPRNSLLDFPFKLLSGAERCIKCWRLYFLLEFPIFYKANIYNSLVHSQMNPFTIFTLFLWSSVIQYIYVFVCKSVSGTKRCDMNVKRDGNESCMWIVTDSCCRGERSLFWKEFFFPAARNTALREEMGSPKKRFW